MNWHGWNSLCNIKFDAMLWSLGTFMESQISWKTRQSLISPVLCNPITPFAANRPHWLCPEIFRILFVLAWHIEWPLLLHDVIDDWMIPFAAKIASAFEWPGQLPKIAPSHWGSNTWFLGPTRGFIQNGISIGSAVFAQFTVECPFTVFSPKVTLSPWGIWSHI